MTQAYKKIAFQGAYGAYSDLACRTMYPNLETVPCSSFHEVFKAVQDGRADLAMIPVDNTIAGRVADVHHLLPGNNLFVVAEHFQSIQHHLMGVPGTKIEDIKHIHSHVHAIPQCRKLIARLGVKATMAADTAGSAREVAERKDTSQAAIASRLAAELYNLEILEENVQDEDHNTTRFLIFAAEPHAPDIEGDTITSLIFQVRNMPAALYKALGGFATNGLSLAKLESYVDENFQAAEFYCEVEGHPESEAFKLALEELGFYAKDVLFLGAYAAHEMRKTYLSRTPSS